jgi:hypothetical protein
MSELDFRGLESRTIATDASEVFVHVGPLTGPALLLLALLEAALAGNGMTLISSSNQCEQDEPTDQANMRRTLGLARQSRR